MLGTNEWPRTLLRIQCDHGLDQPREPNQNHRSEKEEDNEQKTVTLEDFFSVVSKVELCSSPRLFDASHLVI